MNSTLNKTASILAFIIGTMAVFAGWRVRLGKLPHFYVIGWLPVYNYTMGILTVFTTTALIWRNNRLALPVAIKTFTYSNGHGGKRYDVASQCRDLLNIRG